jgi:hypothetical protein
MIAIRTAALLSIAAVLLTPALSAQSADSAPTSRALASPLDSPPFPNADWLGGPVIGQPDGTPDFPLQKAVFGNSLAASRIKIYGWVDLSGNLSTSKNSNAPLAPSIVPNAVELDQLALRIVRLPNTVQTEHLDWGFQSSNIYGIDYRYSTAKGWLSDQLLDRNELYGFDPTELYVMLYLPHIAQGTEFRVGRFISPADLDDPFATDNYLFTHPLAISVDPVTFTGVEAVVRLSPQWALTLGVDAGGDMAPWQNSAQLNGQALVRWVSLSGSDGLWGGINSIGNGQFKNGHDDLQQIILTWGHKFSAKLHMQTEVYYLWQFDAAKGGSCNYGPVKSFGGGGGCGPIIPGRSEAVAAVNYFQVLFSPKDYLSVRFDYLNDVQGQRTGYATPYGTVTAGWEHWLWPLAFLRGEVRHDNAFSSTLTPYDNGTKRDQTTASLDLLIRF